MTCRVTPRYGPTSRNATVSSISTAPLDRKTRAAASPPGNGRASGGASAVLVAATSEEIGFIAAMLRADRPVTRQYMERWTWFVWSAAGLPAPS
ncbi:hypothetical protein GCM10027605_65400 [Micromonospora zhanjiangensis]